MRALPCLCIVGLFACSSPAAGGGAAGATNGGATSTGGGATTGGSSNGGSTGTGGGTASGGSTGTGGAAAGAGGTAMAHQAESMELISKGVPAFASAGTNPAVANDTDPMTAWGPGTEPAWLAYDLSSVPLAKRKTVLVVWNALHTGGYVLDAVGKDYEQRPIDYTIEINTAAGGGSAPTSGWTNVATVTGCDRGTVEHTIALNGANWVRFNVQKSSNPAGGPAIELDVYSIPEGATDSWLLMGDSITYISTPYAWCDIPQLVRKDHPTRFPQTIDAAIGGTNTGTAMGVIDDTMKGFPGRYVALAYGTNDHANQFQMEGLVQKVIAAGKVPVVPHMPWSYGSPEGAQINQLIDALYVKYPEILKGPDLWAVFENRTDLIPQGDVHPNGAGQEVLRQAWAKTISAVP